MSPELSRSDSVASAPDSSIPVGSRKRVLLVAFDFPPRRTSGVYRPTALTKFLGDYGWKPTVLTIQAPTGAVLDEELLRRIPDDVLVHRTRFPRIDGWEAKLLRLSRAIRGRRAPATPTKGGSSAEAGSTENAAGSGSLLRAAAAGVRRLLYFPDTTAGWIPYGLAAALRLHHREPFDVVYTTHPPRAAHVIGMLMKQILGIPWVMEFRDPWSIPENETAISHDQIPAPHRNRWLHQRMLKSCDHVVTVTRHHATELTRSFGVKAEKISVITNGFHEDDFVGIQPNGFGLFDPSFVNIAQFGTVYPGFSGQFFKAVKELFAERPELASRVRFHIIGYPDPVIDAAAHDSALKDSIVIHGFLQHSKVLPLMHAANGLLLFYGHDYTSRASVPGKLYEYLRVGKPIIAVAYPGGVRDIVNEASAGVVLAPEDVGGIKKAITDLAEMSKTGQHTPSPREEVVSRFRYDHLTQSLANVLNGVVARR